MKTSKIIKLSLSTFLAVGLLSACNKDVPIGDPIDIQFGYSSEETGASAAANAEIKEMQDKYGIFIRYAADSADVFWSVFSGTASTSRPIKVRKGDPKNVEAMLQLYDEIWWSKISEDFKKNGAIPYKVFLVDSVFMDMGWNIAMYDYYIQTNSIILPGMNRIDTFDAKKKKQVQKALFNALWADYYTKKTITTPDEFFSSTSYVPPVLAGSSFSPAELEEWRNRGFVQTITVNMWNGMEQIRKSEIFSKYSATTSNWNSQDPRKLDFAAYISQIIYATEPEVEDLMKYDAIKKKWNLIINHYKDNYDIDLRKIALE